MNAGWQREVDAANAALRLLKHPAIASLDEDTHVARTCSEAFGQVRDELLARHPWNFAKAWVTPARLQPDAAGPLKLRYPLPADCILVRFVEGLEAGEWDIDAASLTPGEIAPAARMLVTNSTAPTVCYTRRIEAVVLWDHGFRAAFAAALAAEIAGPITRDGTEREGMEALAERRIMRAKRQDAREGGNRPLTRSTSWLGARR